jgi:hypothetical protein
MGPHYDGECLERVRALAMLDHVGRKFSSSRDEKEATALAGVCCNGGARWIEIARNRYIRFQVRRLRLSSRGLIAIVAAH